MTYCIALAYHANPESLFLPLRHLPDFVWLDSGRPTNNQGRYDIFSAHAVSKASITPAGDTLIDGNIHTQTDALEEWLTRHSHNHEQGQTQLPFTGGVIGYFGYHWQDAAYGIKNQHNYSAPQVQLASYDWAIIIDHHSQTTTGVFANAQHQAINEILALIDDIPSRLEHFTCTPFVSSTSKEEYLRNLKIIEEYILAGDCYQVNFSQRFNAQYTGDLDAAYLALRQATPSPYSAYIKNAHHSVLSLSPERFLQFTGNQVLTQPIKGTAPRGKTPEEDQKFAQALVTSEKNRAENIMIVDLLRNDLSRCCKPFSVKVPHLCELHTFSNVHHLISTITAELKDEFTAFDMFKKSFPGGSITGAPKKRAMEIIAELETTSRGLYCGSVAYFSNNGNADSNITIRTLHAIENQLYCWGGGGVVIDSNAEEEYEESLVKVKKLMAALGHCYSTVIIK